jgi:hypothetical protein
MLLLQKKRRWKRQKGGAKLSKELAAKGLHKGFPLVIVVHPAPAPSPLHSHSTVGLAALLAVEPVYSAAVMADTRCQVLPTPGTLVPLAVEHHIPWPAPSIT